MANEPKTLQEAIVDFADADNCLNYLAARRWPTGVVCPRCGSKNIGFIKSRGLWQCKDRHPKAQFSIKVGTIFEDSAIKLDKWLCAMWMLANCKNRISSHELARTIGVTQKSAWFMLHRLRLALQDKDSGGKLEGEVEVDETYIGGKFRNMHKMRRRNTPRGGSTGKAVVMGMLERKGRVKTRVIKNARKPELWTGIYENVETGTQLYTDEWSAYHGIDAEYQHSVICHANSYVDGQVHTNGIENFWSCLKRSIGGTYVSVEPFHLFRYLDEQAFRYNNRHDMNDRDRFNAVAENIVGKRLTYAEATGKVGETSVH